MAKGRMHWERIGALLLYVRSGVLTLAGLAGLVVAAWLTDPRLGWAASGVALIILDILSHPDSGERKT